ncbi:MAG: metallophosphoesterase [Thermoleophilaceae bacterium]|nr:metallophosphoesterase [Thermoleophilaceae bacterium]
MLALLYDVHGNLPALEAVLADAEAAGASSYMLGGDYAVAGGWPVETVARLRALDARWIRGNTERWLADPSDAPEPALPVIEACREALGAGLVAELVALPLEHRSGGTLFCHASPGSDMLSFLPQPAAADQDVLAGETARRVVFGHTHLAFRRPGPDGVDLINPGSVGMPWDGDRRAAYALVKGDGVLEHRRVAYDHRASAERIREFYGPAGELAARRLEQARFDAS